MTILAALRQLSFPVEFRIHEPGSRPDLAHTLDQLRLVLDECNAGNSGELAQESSPTSTTPSQQLFADLGTALWRLKQRMVEPGTGRPREDMRRAFRHLESAWDALVDAGVEIIDHTDSPYQPGMTVSVIEFQPTLGLTREWVIETIKPTIYIRDKHVQLGEVIVGTPATHKDRGADGADKSSRGVEQ